MSGKSYPRIGRTSLQRKWEKLPAKAAPKCSACDQPARFRVDVEVNWFRGDDECGRACDLHKNDAYALLAGIERHQAKQKDAREAKANGSATLTAQQLIDSHRSGDHALKSAVTAAGSAS